MIIHEWSCRCDSENIEHRIIKEDAPTLCPNGHTITDYTISQSSLKNLPGGVYEDLTLETYKFFKSKAIHDRTLELLEGGFPFDNEIFGSDAVERMNYGHLKQFEGLLTWPVSLATLDNKEYVLELVNLDNFIGTALGYANSYLKGGIQLKNQVSLSATKAEVDAVIDNR